MLQFHRQRGAKIISKLTRVRKVKGLSQDQLSKLSGVSRVTIARIESGASSPTIRTLEKIADALKVPVTDILEGGLVAE